MQSQKTLTGRGITRKNERIATLLLTVQSRVANSPKECALRMVYAEAIVSGAGTFDREKWQHALGNLGATIEVSAHDGDVDFSVLAMDTTLPRTLALLEALFTDPHFKESELARIKTHLINTLLCAKEDARRHAHEAFLEKVFSFTDRRTAYPIDTIIEEVKKVRRVDVVAFHKSLWNSPWLFTSGGDKSVNARCAKVMERIRSLRGSGISREYVPENSIAGKKTAVVLHSIPSKQNIEFSIGGALPLTRDSAEYPAFVFGMSVLSIYGGFTGRLMSIVREKEGLTYNIYGRSEGVTKEETGVWRIGTFFNQKDVLKGVTSTLREVSRMQAKGITEDELKRFKVILATRYALTHDSLLKEVGEAHGLAKIGVTEAEYDAFKSAIQNLTRTEVNRVMAKYLDSKRLVISGAGPIEGVEKDLKRFG